MIRSQPLYQHLLGDAWDQLGPQIRELHSVVAESSFCGDCHVERGRHPLAWLIAASIGLPVAGAAQEILVRLRREGDGERWIRQIGARRFSSLQEPGRGSRRGMIRERFGPFAIYMTLVAEAGCLRYVIRHWTLCSIPLPLALGPRATAIESVDEGRFRFDVELRHVLTGLIVRYQGALSPILDRSTSSAVTFSP